MMRPQDVLEPCFEDLESRLDPEQEERHFEAWRAFLDDELSTGVFEAPAREPAPPRVEWPDVHINDALDDPDFMLLSQFRAVSDVLASGGSAALNVRANYGVSIMASQYGCEVVQMDREQGDLPTARALGSRDAVRRVLDAGMPDIAAADGGRAFETGQRFVEVAARYPNIGRWVDIYHPDLQGPIDIVELVWGSDMFLAFYDDADLLRDFLALITDHYVTYLKAWYDLVPPPSPYACHWGLRFKGQPMIRNDSLMNLSSDTYVEFIRPHDQRIIREFGGRGAIHFCGRGEHFIESLSEIEGLTAVNLTQPELNDMSAIYEHTVDKGIMLIGLARSAVEAAGRDLCGRVHVL
jgi:hypothetical protein